MLERMDERLRALGRLAAADEPTSWARLRGLARSRARRDLILEAGRLARSGDPAAREALGAWAPLRSLPLAPAAAAADAWTSDVRVVEAAWLDPAAVLALGEEDALVHRAVGQGWGRVSAITLDGEAPTERWSSDTGGAIAWRGEDVVHASPRSRAGGVLVARDLATGEVIDRTPIKDRVWSLSIAGERGLIRSGDPQALARVSCFDAAEGAFGRPLWSRDLPFGVEAHLAGDRVIELDAGGVRGLDLETGAVVWTRDEDDLPGLSLEHALAFAGEGRLVLHAAPDELHDAVTISLDPATGATRWWRRHGWLMTPVVGGDRVVFCEPAERLLALDLLTGVPAWEAPLPSTLHARAGRRVLAAVDRPPRSLPTAPGQLARHDAVLVELRGGRALAASPLEAPATATISVLVTDGWAAVAASSRGRLARVEFQRSALGSHGVDRSTSPRVES